MSRASRSHLRARQSVTASQDNTAPTNPPAPPRAKAPAQKRRKVEPLALASPSPPTQVAAHKTQAQKSTVPKAPAIWAKVKGRRGHLKMVVEMPFDILLEIFRYVNPYDLVTLSRASRALRALLLDRPLALPVWQSAFAHALPIPPRCPEDISLPHYASFLYGRECFGCGTVSLKLEKFHTALVSLCHITCVERYCGDIDESDMLSGARSETIAHLRALVAITPSAWVLPPAAKSMRAAEARAYRRKYERYVRYLPAFLKHVAEFERLLEAGGSTSQYLEEQGRLNRERTELKPWLLKWEAEESRAKKKAIEDRRDDRQEAITKKLVELGFEDVLRHENKLSLTNLPGVKGAKPLTKKGWKSIEPSIVQALTELRKINVHQDTIRALGERTAFIDELMTYSLSHNRDLEAYAPDAGSRQLAKLEPFKGLVYDTPVSKKLQLSDFLDLVDAIPEAIRSWRDAAAKVLLGLLPNGMSSSKGKAKAPDASVLHLATTLFSCKWCTDILCYPAVLHHPCLLKKHKPSDEQNWDDKDDVKQETEDDKDLNDMPEQSSVEYQTRWNEDAKQVQFDESSSDYARFIIRALNRNPETVTWMELDEANVRVECLRCVTTRTRYVMDWKAAIIHEHEDHTDDTERDAYKTAWKALDSKMLEVAHAKEASTRRVAKRHVRKEYCVECGMGSIVEGHIFVPFEENLVPLPEGAVQCAAGHDVVNGHGVYDGNPYDMQFDKNIAVKIPL